MKSLPELIHDYKSGVPGTDAKILQRMQPLIKGTAAKIHCMEREDSQQELYLSLLRADAQIAKILKKFFSCLNRTNIPHADKIREALILLASR